MTSYGVKIITVLLALAVGGARTICACFAMAVPPPAQAAAAPDEHACCREGNASTEPSAPKPPAKCDDCNIRHASEAVPPETGSKAGDLHPAALLSTAPAILRIASSVEHRPRLEHVPIGVVLDDLVHLSCQLSL